MPEINTALLIALLPAILGLVNFIKSLGVSGRALTIVSMVVGVAGALAAQLLEPTTFNVIFNGIILGLAACGLYDLAAMVTAKKAAG